jgi:hypothetical protein
VGEFENRCHHYVKVLEKNPTLNNNQHEMPEAISPKCKWCIGLKKGSEYIPNIGREREEPKNTHSNWIDIGCSPLTVLTQTNSGLVSE